jgi:hypothetical protein
MYVDGAADPDTKTRLLLGGKWTLTEAIRQALKLHAVLVAASNQQPGTREPVTRHSAGADHPHQGMGHEPIRKLELCMAGPSQDSCP